MSNRRAINAPMIAAALTTVMCLSIIAGHGRTWTVPGLDRLERTSIDARFRVRGPRPPVDDRIVIVGIDDETRQRHPDLTQVRRNWADLIDKLARYRPQLIALDLFFSSKEEILEPALAEEIRATYATLGDASELAPAKRVLGKLIDELRGDEVLAASIRDAGNVYLGCVFVLAEAGETVPAEAKEVPGTALARFGDSVAAGDGNQPNVAELAIATRPEIGAGARGAGTVNILVDDDGETRAAPLVIQHGGRHYLPLGAAIAMAALGRNDASYVGGEDHATIAGRRVPLGPGATALLDFLGPGRTFRHVSAADVVDGTAPPDALAGKLVIVGYTYGAFDKIATPFDQLSDGVELHATLAHNLLHGELLAPGGRGMTLAVIAMIGAIFTVLQLRRLRRRPWVPALAAIAVVIAWVIVAYWAMAAQRVMVEMIAPLTSAAVIAIAAGVTSLATEGREKARLRTAFSQYVSSTLVERILASPEMAHLGGERRTLTVLFTDIRGFSGLAETLEPEKLAGFLNEYLTPMTEIVLASDGTLDKYIGDAVMAIWGAPLDVPDHADRACASALAMLARLSALNARWRAAGLPEIAIGVGLNTGTMAVGNMGSEARFDYTVLGDAVNLAARLEGLTKEYGVDALAGEGTARAAGGHVFRELDWVRVKGREGTAAVFELVGPKGAARYGDAELARWREALEAYRARDFARAVEIWGDLALRHPDDGAAAIMRARAERLRAEPPPPEWDGVYDQRSK